MSETTRYDIEYLSEYGETSGMAVRPDGDYVLYADYATLRTRLAAAQEESDYIAKGHAKALRERDEARRERDAAIREVAAMGRQLGKEQARADAAEREREAMRAVVEAADEWEVARVQALAARMVAGASGGSVPAPAKSETLANMRLVSSVRAYRTATAQPGGEG